MDPDFAAALMADKEKLVGNYWDSPEWDRVNEATGGVVAGPGHGVLALGCDFFQPYVFVQHSTGAIFVRSGSLLLCQLMQFSSSMLFAGLKHQCALQVQLKISASVKQSDLSFARDMRCNTDAQ